MAGMPEIDHAAGAERSEQPTTIRTPSQCTSRLPSSNTRCEQARSGARRCWSSSSAPGNLSPTSALYLTESTSHWIFLPEVGQPSKRARNDLVTHEGAEVEYHISHAKPGCWRVRWASIYLDLAPEGEK